MVLVETIITTILLFLIVSFVNKWTAPEESQDFKKTDDKSSFASLITCLITFGIIYSLRLGIGSFWWLFDYGFWRIEFFFALMITIYFPLSIPLSKKLAPRLLEEDLFREKKLKKRYKLFLILIGVSWIVGLVFLSIDLLQIPMNWDLRNTQYDVFPLGFIWAFTTVIIVSFLTGIGNRFMAIEKRIPKVVFKKASNVASIISFGIWSIQLIIVELYLKRVFNLPVWEQDIRILFFVITGIYFACFILFLKYKFLPEATQKSSRKLEVALNLIEEKQVEDKKIERDDVVLEVHNLITYFYTEEGIVRAVEGVSFKIFKGEVLGLVGETGCGKSVTALSILRLIRPPGRIEGGEIILGGENLLEKSQTEMLRYRGNQITMIFQDPLNSINPVLKVGDQITEVYHLHKEDELLVDASKNPDESIFSIARKRAENLLHDVGIPAPEGIFDRYPHELSGGMRQRVQIAIALACEPKLLIADEPTTALDVTIQNQILKLMKDLRESFDTSILFITHDLRVTSKMCDRVAVMYSGYIVEYGKIHRLFKDPYHPYTKGLVKAMPKIGMKRKRLETISGIVPNLIYPPSGCRFHPRCEYCFKPCDKVVPRTIEVEPNYYVACHLYDPQFKDLVKKE